MTQNTDGECPSSQTRRGTLHPTWSPGVFRLQKVSYIPWYVLLCLVAIEVNQPNPILQLKNGNIFMFKRDDDASSSTQLPVSEHVPTANSEGASATDSEEMEA